MREHISRNETCEQVIRSNQTAGAYDEQLES